MKPVLTFAAALLVPLVTSMPSAPGCDMLCMDVNEPVCGSDGKTYTNKCQPQLADCNNRGATGGDNAITLVATGECVAPSTNGTTPADQCVRMCADVMQPVCGSNAVTYNNKYEFENAKCTLKIATMTMTPGACA